jgi:hypothetical protein
MNPSTRKQVRALAYCANSHEEIRQIISDTKDVLAKVKHPYIGKGKDLTTQLIEEQRIFFLALGMKMEDG